MYRCPPKPHAFTVGRYLNHGCVILEHGWGITGLIHWLVQHSYGWQNYWRGNPHPSYGWHQSLGLSPRWNTSRKKEERFPASYLPCHGLALFLLYHTALLQRQPAVDWNPHKPWAKINLSSSNLLVLGIVMRKVTKTNIMGILTSNFSPIYLVKPTLSTNILEWFLSSECRQPSSASKLECWQNKSFAQG